MVLARWLWWQVPIWLVGAFVVRLAPDYGGAIFAISGVLALGIGIWKTRHHGRAVADQRRA